MSSQNNPSNIEASLSYYGWVVVGMGFLATLIGFGLVYAFGVFFKPLATEFGWSRSVTAGAFSAYAIIHTLLAFATGRLIDRVGPKPIFAVAGLCNGLCMILMSTVTQVWELYVYYGIIFSLGIAATYVPSMSIVTKWFNIKRGVAVGLTAAGIGAGSMIFSPLSGWLITTYGWRTAYIILGILAWVVFIPVVIFIKKAPDELIETKSKSDSGYALSFLEAFKTGTFWAFSLAWMFIAFAMWAIIVHLVPLATDMGMPIVKAGALVGLVGFVSLFGRIGGGFLSDIIGRKKVFISALVLHLIVTIWLFFMKEVWMLLPFAIFFGLGVGGCAGVLPAIPADYFGSRAAGTIIGFAVTIAGIGIALGPYLGGVIYDFTKSYDYMIIMCIISMIAGIISASYLRPVKKIQAN